MAKPPQPRILYATQSGRSRACARRASRLLNTPHVSSFDDDPWLQETLLLSATTDPKPILVLVVSTTGDGEHTDTIQSTWNKLLQRSLPSDLFTGVGFFMFGVGDRAYGEQFCAAARKLVVRLQQLGAVLLQKPAFGDCGGNFWTEYDDWISGLLPALGIDPSDIDNPDLSWKSKYIVEIQGTEAQVIVSEDDLYCSFRQSRAPSSASNVVPVEGTVSVNKRLTPESWEYDTRHIRFRVSASYNAGDVAAVLPRNDPTRVEAFLRVLPLSIQSIADAPLQVRSCELTNNQWPNACTLRGWLINCADIEGLPEREDLRSLAGLCSLTHENGAEQQRRLCFFSETKGTALYTDYITREKRSWMDVIYDFDSLRHDGSQLTLGHLFSLLPPIRPREFSIASSPNNPEPDILELCVGIVKGTTRLKRNYLGLCSNFLANAVPGETKVHLWIRPGLFNASFGGPLLCIGAGTGIAPLRSVLLDRHLMKSDALVFGCRKSDADFYYVNDWGHLLWFRVAYSQEDPKAYVQQVVSPAELAQHPGAIYVAGNPRMARAIQASLLLGLQTIHQCSEKEARRVLKQLQRSGRFVVEAWS